MTNQKILKRFKFDLNVMFKNTFEILCYIDLVNSKFYRGQINPNKVLKLVKVLKELGYKDTSIHFMEKEEYYPCARQIVVNHKYKTFKVKACFEDYKFGTIINRNKYPKYVLKYNEELNND